MQKFKICLLSAPIIFWAQTILLFLNKLQYKDQKLEPI